MFLLLDATTVLTPGAAPSVTWSPGLLYVAIQPYILVVFGTLFSALLAWACAIFQKRTGIVVSQNAQNQIQTAAMNAAGRIMASQDDRFAAVKVDVSSPLVQAEIPVVSGLVTGAVNQLGLTPDRVGQLIAGKLGQLQAQAQAGLPTVTIASQNPAVEVVK